MYYLELIDRFWIFNDQAKLTPSSVTLYLYLLKTARDFNHYQFAVSDMELGNQLGLNRATVKAAKEKLRDCGLICFATVKAKPCNYRIVVDYSLEVRKQDSLLEEFNEKQIEKDEQAESQCIDDQDFDKATSVKMLICSDSRVDGNSVLLDGKGEIPDLGDFLEYAKTLPSFDDEKDYLVIDKYNSWRESGWKNSSGRSIINWRSSLKNILPFLTPGTRSPK